MGCTIIIIPVLWFKNILPLLGTTRHQANKKIVFTLRALCFNELFHLIFQFASMRIIKQIVNLALYQYICNNTARQN